MLIHKEELLFPVEKKTRQNADVYASLDQAADI